VLGGRVITELNQNGEKIKGYVFAGGEVLAKQEYDFVAWQHVNPLTGSRGESGVSGGYAATVEADPMGVNVGVEDPFIEPLPVGFEPSPETPMIGGLGGGGGCSSYNPNCTRCFLDGFAIGCEQAAFLMDVGSAVQPRIQTVTAYGRNGQVLGSTSRTVLPGDPGYDGSLDGRYRQSERRVDGQSFSVGWRTFTRVSGGGGSSDVSFGHGRSQEPEKIWVPIGNLENLLEKTLAYGDCNEFLKKLLNTASLLGKGKNNARASDIMTLYHMVDNQLHGGFELDYPGEYPHYGHIGSGNYMILKGVSGGSGAEWGSWAAGNVTVWIHRKAALKNENFAKSLARLPYDYVETAIHEIFHAAGEKGSYSHELMNQAANEYEPGLTFDQAMKKHCIPSDRR
jgi:hypothetical protein